MKTSGITFASQGNQYVRLQVDDIIRKPNVTKKNIDYFLHTSTREVSPKKYYWRNFYAAATFGLTGLYIAHRNNLFNPVKKEVKKIVNSEKFKNEIKQFVYGKLNSDTYDLITMKVLREMSKDRDDFALDKAVEAVNTYTSDKRFSNLFDEVKKVLTDDKNELSRKNGFVVDVIDKLATDFENLLKKRKENNKSINDQADALMNYALKPDKNNNSKVYTALIDVISNRIGSTVDNFIKSAVSDAKFGNIQS